MRLCRERAPGQREFHDRADALALELPNVELPDAGNEAQMVVGTPAAVTVQPVRAHVAVGNGLWIGRGRRAGGSGNQVSRTTQLIREQVPRAGTVLAPPAIGGLCLSGRLGSEPDGPRLHQLTATEPA